MKKNEIAAARREAKRMLLEAGIVLPRGGEVEITDFGKGDYRKTGLGLFIKVNEPEYASKWLTVLPGQVCPNHYHKLIKETFIVIRGDITLSIDGERHVLGAGETITLPPGTWHEFTSSAGAVVEEVTTRQYPDDSCFADQTIRRYVSEEEG